MTESESPSRCIAHRLDWTADADGADRPGATSGSAPFDSTTRGIQHASIVISPAIVMDEPSRGEFVRRLGRLREASVTPIAIEASLPCPIEPPDRKRTAIGQAVTEIIALLDAAAAAGINLVILHPAGGRHDAHPALPREESCNHFIEVLLAARFDAEARAARIAFDVSSADFLGTPSAARAMIDECNSYWAGAHVAFEWPIVSTGEAAEWMAALGRRVYAVTVIAPESSVSADGVSALRDSSSMITSNIRQSFALDGFPRGCPFIV